MATASLPSIYVWLVVIFPFVGALLTPLLSKLGGRVRDYAAVAFSALVVVVALCAVRTVVRNRDWRDNLTLLSADVQTCPHSAKLLAAIGTEHFKQGKLDLADRELRAALQIDEDLPDALETEGLLQLSAGNYQSAGAMMERALNSSTREDPNYDFMVVNFAGVLMQTDHPEGALRLLNREIAESPHYARAWANRAVLLYGRGDTDSARADAQTALRLDPANQQAQAVLRHLEIPSRK